MRSEYYSKSGRTKEGIDSQPQEEPNVNRQASLAHSIIGPDALNAGQSFHSNIYFEEYLYWAQITRADEQNESPTPDELLLRDQDPRRRCRFLNVKGLRFWASADEKRARSTPTTESGNQNDKNTAAAVDQELVLGSSVRTRTGDPPPARDPRHIPILDEEWIRASRAARTASWSAVFYLLTMDILGPFYVPWAFAALGYGPGITIYTVLCGLATYGGFMLWKLFLGLDSDRYPVRTYADLVFRIYGSAARSLVSVLQSTQLLFNVGIIILINGLSLEQIITGSGRDAICFIVLCLVWALAGMIFGQIRTLRRLAWLANFAIWLNAFSIFAIMGVVANSGVLRSAAQRANASFRILPDAPIATTAGILPNVPFTVTVTAVMAAVYSFGGAIVFIEFLSEMRRPLDFWKSLVCAEAFIYCLYLFFGVFVYAHQGQYTFNPTYQGLAPYGWHAAINAIQLVTSCVATLLYANIGLKVLFNNLFIDVLGAPQLSTPKGKVLWAFVVPVYWSLAFVIATAIPQVSNLGGLIASACVLQFSFTFPPLMMVGYNVRKDGMLPGDGWDPATGAVVRQDGGGWARLWRGYRRKLLLNVANTLLSLAAAALAVLGMYSAIKQIVAYYAGGASTSFSCSNPYAG